MAREIFSIKSVTEIQLQSQLSQYLQIVVFATHWESIFSAIYSVNEVGQVKCKQVSRI